MCYDESMCVVGKFFFQFLSPCRHLPGGRERKYENVVIIGNSAPKLELRVSKTQVSVFTHSVINVDIKNNCF